jgi:hypothetical protein
MKFERESVPHGVNIFFRSRNSENSLFLEVGYEYEISFKTTTPFCSKYSIHCNTKDGGPSSGPETSDRFLPNRGLGLFTTIPFLKVINSRLFQSGSRL